MLSGQKSPAVSRMPNAKVDSRAAATPAKRGRPSARRPRPRAWRVLRAHLLTSATTPDAARDLALRSYAASGPLARAADFEIEAHCAQIMTAHTRIRMASEF